MTAINNLQGHIVKDGKVVYSEELEKDITFIVIEMYEPKYDTENAGGSSKLWLEAAISTGKAHTWSNGIRSLLDNQRQEYAPFPELRELQTKDGFKVWEHAHSHHKLNGKDSRRVTWLVEVPKDRLAQFFAV